MDHSRKEYVTMTQEEMIKRIEDLEEKMKLLESQTTIPLNIEKAFKNRLEVDTKTTISADSKAASSENQAVNEAGSATYSVLKTPDRFVRVVINGNNRYLPAYD